MTQRIKARIQSVLRAVWVGVVVVIGLSALLPSCSRPAAYAATRQADPNREAAAIAAVDRFRSEFERTMSVEPLLDEHFVRDVGRRNVTAGLVCGIYAELGVGKDLLAELDDAAARRAVTAVLDVVLLHVAHSVRRPNQGGRAPDFEEVETIPDEVRAAILESERLTAFLEDEPIAAVTTRSEFEALVSDLERVGDAFRRSFGSGIYPAPESRQLGTGCAGRGDTVVAAVADRSSGYQAFGVAPEETVLEVVRDGLLWFDVVSEQGRMRILSIDVAADL